MNYQISSFLVLYVFSMCNLFSQKADNTNNTIFTLNIGHSVTVLTASKAISNDVTYFPVHINIQHSIQNKLGVSGLLIYRLDKDGDSFRSHEFGFAVGPSYITDNLNGFWADFKMGIAKVFGENYYSDTYQRTDLVIQPEIGYNINFSNQLVMTFGIGLQSLVKLSEKPDRSGFWEWNITGKLSHYYLPVLNISLGFKS